MAPDDSGEIFDDAVERNNLDAVDFVRSVDGVDYYAANSPDGPVVIESEPGEYAEVTPTEEWLYRGFDFRNTMRDWLGRADPAQEFQEGFWKRTPTVKHATEPDNAAGIVLDGELQAGNETRGMGNRSVSSAVFASEQGHISVYGNAVFHIDTQSMKDAGLEPTVEREPEVIEEQRRSTIASMFHYDYWEEYTSSVSPDTVIIYDDIPLEHLSLEAGSGTIEQAVEAVVAAVQNAEYSPQDGLDAIDWFEGQNDASDIMPVYENARGKLK